MILTKNNFLKYFFLSGIFLLNSITLSFAQDDLMQMLEEETSAVKNRDFTQATFKGTRIINGQSVENPAKGVLQALISHRFGTISSGAYNLFGLDAATIRLGFDYGISNHLTVGIGRSTVNKAFDGYLKCKLLRQSKGNVKMPVTVVGYFNTTINTAPKSTQDLPLDLTSRLIYTYQLMIARKFSERLSLQVSPTFLHRNLVATRNDQHDIWALGFAGRFKLSRRISLCSEYYYLLPGYTSDNFSDSFAVGFDIETGGHVFQVHVTNSAGMIESQFIPSTTDNWSKGDIRIGFNISRVFTLCKSKNSNQSW
ncbi:MAG: DUF5777 family beta-barrel protein [Cytophagaceae bacterium]